MSDLDKKDLVKSAKEFVREKNKGLSSRIRLKLDDIKPALAILVNERLSVPNIQEYIHRHAGLKIGQAPVKRYLLEHFNYPAPGRSEPSTTTTRSSTTVRTSATKPTATKAAGTTRPIKRTPPANKTSK